MRGRSGSLTVGRWAGGEMRCGECRAVLRETNGLTSSSSSSLSVVAGVGVWGRDMDSGLSQRGGNVMCS